MKQVCQKHAEKISGETFAEQYLGRRLACSHCPVDCIHIAALREPYEDESYLYKMSMISYDYEPIYALGSMLGLSDAQGFLKLMDQVEILGLDVMSTGVILSWATEALECGIISEKQTIGEEILKEKYIFKFREGFSFDNIPIPGRIFETPSPVGSLDEKFMRDVLAQVKKVVVE